MRDLRNCITLVIEVAHEMFTRASAAPRTKTVRETEAEAVAFVSVMRLELKPNR